MKDAGGQDQAADEVGAPQRRHQRHDRAVAGADEVGGPADDPLDEGDRVRGHQLVGDRPVDVGGAPVAAALGREDAKARHELVEVRPQGARVDPAGMQQHERLPVAMLVVPGVDTVQVNVLGHATNVCMPAPKRGQSLSGRSGEL